MKRRICSMLIMLMTVFSLGAATYSGTMDDTRLLGVEVKKANRNHFKVMTSVVAPPAAGDENAWTNYVTDAKEQLNINFDTINSNTTPPPEKFQIRYEFETPGTMLVFFSAKNELGFNSEGADFYKNPKMLESFDDPTHYLNYNITCNSKMAYYITEEGGGHWEEMTDHGTCYSFKNGMMQPSNQLIEDVVVVDIPGSDHNPNGGMSGVVDPVIKSGMVFRKQIHEGGVRGADTYTLEMTKPQKDGKEVMFEAGFYTGFIIIHFAAL